MEKVGGGERCLHLIQFVVVQASIISQIEQNALGKGLY